VSKYFVSGGFAFMHPNRWVCVCVCLCWGRRVASSPCIACVRTSSGRRARRAHARHTATQLYSLHAAPP
jgi:hypothetical protein